MEKEFNMTLKEVMELKKDIERDFEKSEKIVVDFIKSKKKSLKGINKLELPLKSERYITFVDVKYTDYVDASESSDVDEIHEILKDNIRRYCKNSLFADVSCDYCNYGVDFKIKVYNELTPEKREVEIMRILKNEVGNKIGKVISCEVFANFIENKITWEQMVDITKTNCNV